MKRIILTAAIIAALGLPSIASAQATPLKGSIICRPINSGETPNATVQGTQLLCRSLDMAKLRDSMNSVGKLMDQLSVEMNKMKDAAGEFASQLQLPPIPGSNGGIEE